MKTPLVSVVLPVYNGETFLNSAIESILSQTFNDYELIVIDDGSIDSSSSILKKYASLDERIKPYTNDGNKGLIHTLNLGLNLSKGKYICRMDADDISLPDRLIKQFGFMESNPSVGVCGAWAQCIGQYDGVLHAPVDHESIVARMFCQSTIWHPLAFIRKSVLEDNSIQYNSDFLQSEDYKLWVDISKVSKLHNLPEILLHYRIHNNQVSLRSNKSVQKIRNQQLEMFFEGRCDENNFLMSSMLHFDVPFEEKSTLTKIETWIEYLKKENLKRRVYSDHTTFSKTLDESFQLLCKNRFYYSVRNKGKFTISALFDLIQEGLNSHLGHFQQQEIARIFIKCLLGYRAIK